MNAEPHFDDIFRRFQLVSGTRTQAELAKVLGIRQSSISDAKKRNSVPAEWYLKFFEQSGVNPDWLKKGLGPTYLRTEAGYGAVCGNSKYRTDRSRVLAFAESIPTTVYAAYGRTEESGTPTAGLRSVGRLALPQSHAGKDIIVFATDNDAAAPTARRGAYVGVNTSLMHPVYGELFAVALPYGETGFRRLFSDREGENVILRAENAAYPDLRLSGEDCLRRILGRVVWVLQRL